MAKLKNDSNKIVVANKFIEIGKSLKFKQLETKSNIDKLKTEKKSEATINYAKKQYYISTSDTVVENGVWIDEKPSSYEGFLWERDVFVHAGGKTDFGNPIPIKRGHLYSVKPDSESFNINKADAVGRTTYYANVIVTDYTEEDLLDAIYNVTITGEGGVSTDISDISWTGTRISFKIKNNTNYTRITISVVGKYGENASCLMYSKDITVYYAYAGKLTNVNNDDAEAILYFTNNYGGVLSGYNYIDQTHKTIRYYNGSQWTVLSLSEDRASEILSGVEADFWDMFEGLSESEKEIAWNTYGYKKEIISSAMATSKLVMYGDGIIASNGISTNKSEDIDSEGFLTKSGYRLEGDRGSGQGGTIRSKDSYFNSSKAKSLTVLEILNLQKPDGSTYAQIIHPALETNDGTPSDDSQYGAKDDANAWDSSLLYNAQGILKRTFYANGDDNSRYLYYMIKDDSQWTNTGTSAYKTEGINSGAVVKTYYNQAPFNCSIISVSFGKNNYSETVTIDANIQIKINGVTVSNEEYYTTIPPEGRLFYYDDQANISQGSEIEISISGDVTGSAYILSSFRTNDTNYLNTKFPNKGIYLYRISNSWEYIQSNEYVSDISLSLEKNYSGIGVDFDSDDYIRYCKPVNIGSYSSFVSGGETYTIEQGIPYSVTGQIYDENNTLYEPLLLTVINSGQTVSIALSNGNTITMDKDIAGRWHGYVKIQGIEAGITTKNIIPKVNLAYDIGRVGSDPRRVRNIYCQTCNESSSIEQKTNVNDFTDKALDIINKVKIVDYNFITDVERVNNGEIKEEDIPEYVGFIAEYTDPILSGKSQKEFISRNCIGVLIKAVQELSEEVKTLKNKA